ncbi:MAG: SDR family NAD(P)-dependent oxidoreductase [Pseudomonadota bacterium]
MTEPSSTPLLLEGRIALVTGASRGIGRAVARAYAAEGAHVVATARTVGGLEELDDEIRQSGGAATLVPLDLADLDGIDRLGAALHERFGRLDNLVACAGVLGELTPLAHLDQKVWDKTFAINATATWRLVRSVDPLLRASPNARALFVSSSVTHRLRPYWGAYTVSKAALEAIALTYAEECANTPIRVNIIDPGATRTRMRAQAMPGEDPSALPTAEDVAPLFTEMGAPGYAQNGARIAYREWRGDAP